MSDWKIATAGPERRRLALAVALGAALAACSGARPPQPPPPETGVAGTTVPATPTPESPTEPAATTTPREPESPEPVVVIEPVAEEGVAAPTLAEAARRERERRRESGQPIAVITDANLAEHATGVLTFVEEEQAAAEGEGEEAANDANAPGERDEAWWRERVRTLRQRWADTAARVPELEKRVAELRREFYDTDDAYYRDTRIKPAWDRAIDQIAETRAEAEAHRLELQAVLEEGRRAGALPGWLREGIELEPAPPEPESEIHEPGEPKILEVDGR